MSSHLAPCPECRRHARIDDPCCPFCGSVAPRVARAPIATARRLTRAAVFFAGAVSLAACDGQEDPGGAEIYGGPPSDESQEPVYGGPPQPPVVNEEQQADPTEPVEEEPDPNAQVPMYGAPGIESIV